MSILSIVKLYTVYKEIFSFVAGVVTRARFLCNSAHVLLERPALEALDVRFLRRSLACSRRPLSRCIATAFVERSLISERAARAPAFGFHCSCVRNSLSLSALSLSRSLCQLSAFLSASPRLSAPLSLCVSLSASASLSASNSRSAARLDLRVCQNLSLRLRLSSFRPRLHWRSRQKSTTTPASIACVVQWPPAYLRRSTRAGGSRARSLGSARRVLVPSINAPVRIFSC